LLRLKDSDPRGELFPDCLQAREIREAADVIAALIQPRVAVHCVDSDQPSPLTLRGLSPLS
jgi:hypothetical protein